MLGSTTVTNKHLLLPRTAVSDLSVRFSSLAINRVVAVRIACCFPAELVKSLRVHSAAKKNGSWVVPFLELTDRFLLELEKPGSRPLSLNFPLPGRHRF